MGIMQCFLYVFIGHFIAATPLSYQNKINAFDSVSGSQLNWNPSFRMLTEFPPIVAVPRVQVFCDESKLTLLVNKKSFGLSLTKEEIQLGNGCYSNKELPTQFAFVYDLDQCGTTLVPRDGLQAFTNSLHLNLKKTTPTWWETPPSVYIYCIPRRLNKDADFVPTPAVTALSFNIQAMDSSWSSAAESNIYERGEVINLQVSAKIGPHQQLFIQSCSVSASPEPYTRPRHAVILNKGCSSSMGSPHTVAQFAASNRADVVNFMLDTSNLVSELYVHCNLVISDKGVTSVSKSCNYNGIQSRWEELSGAAEVCGCCSSKCKGSLGKLEGAKAMVSIGPLVIADNIGEGSPEGLDSVSDVFVPATNSMLSTLPEPAEDAISKSTNQIDSAWDLSLLTMVDGWPVHP